jgi:hypothetical protein
MKQKLQELSFVSSVYMGTEEFERETVKDIVRIMSRKKTQYTEYLSVLRLSYVIKVYFKGEWRNFNNTILKTRTANRNRKSEIN